MDRLQRRGSIACLITVVGACGGAGSGGVPAVSVPQPLSIRTDGSGDALALAMLVAASHLPAQDLTPSVRAPRPDVVARALDALEVSATVGGARLDGSLRVQRLALDRNPADRNGDGLVFEELVQNELHRFAGLAGGDTGTADDAPVVPVLFTWREGDLGLQRPVRRFGELPVYGTRPGARVGQVDLRHVGHSLAAAAGGAAGLLRVSRGDKLGADPRSGVRAAVLLQRALAIEEAVVGALHFDGAVLGAVDPATYDPATAVASLPRRVRVVEPVARAGDVHSYAVMDPASDLHAVAAMLRGASLLAWMAGTRNPEPAIVRAFRGVPFATQVSNEPPERIVNFAQDVGPILAARCTVCHGGPFPQNGLSLESFAGLMQGGITGAQLVVPGDHRASPLWLVINGLWTRSTGEPFPQMPFGGPPLTQAQIDTIAEWIDQGAVRDPVALPAPTDVGRGLARVLVRNLRRLHAVEVETGGGLALQHRVTRVVDGVGHFEEGSGHFEAMSTGLALSALAQALAAEIEEPGLEEFLRRVVVGSDVVPAGSAVGSAATEGIGGLASLTAGLMAAGRVLQDADALRRGRALGVEIVTHPLLRGVDLVEGVRLDPVAAARVVEALVELEVDGAVTGASLALERFLAGPVAAFAATGAVPGTVVAMVSGVAPGLAAFVDVGPPVVPAAEITWAEDVLPLFVDQCAGCHIGGAAESGFRVDSPGLIRRGGDSGRSDHLVGGDALRSLLFLKLARRPPPVGAQMPLGRTPLDDRGLARVARWIQAGALQR